MSKLYKNKKKHLKKALFIIAILAYPMALFLLMYVYINLNSILLAFKTPSFGNTPSKFAGFTNFKKFFDLIKSSTGIMNIALKNSLKMYVINFIIGVPVSIIFSYLLFRKVFGHKFLRAAIMIPQVISSMVIALLFKNFVDSALPSLFREWTGNSIFLLSNDQYAFGTAMFYMIWTSFGTSCIVYSNSMNEIDKEILESAQIDGASNIFQELRYIILPMIFPTLTTFFVTGFATILTATGPMMTFYYTSAKESMYTVGYYYNVKVLTDTSQTSFNMLSAGGLVMTAVMAPLTYLLKHLLEKYGQGTLVEVKPEALASLQSHWRETRVVGEKNGLIEVICYFGSSTYTTQEFTVLLDGIIAEMYAEGLTPPSDQERWAMIERWAKDEKCSSKKS